ncbi:MAG: hypothetical protein LUE92_12020 [Clostridiales bacterium]|nr:hypothetical protein [Clostridiales bacterium]
MGGLITEKQDLTYLTWSRIRRSSGTAGSFLKAYSELGGKKIYYKLSNYDSVRGVIGHECVNELIVDRLLELLGIEHLHYQLIHADVMLGGKVQEVYLCASEDFKQRGESKIALDVYYESERLEGETPLDFCIRNGWSEYIYQMFVVDFLILNRDRHGANIEVLRNSRKKTMRLTPLFDHGLSLLFQCLTDDAVAVFDVMEDRLTNTFIGSRSVQDNLRLIPVDARPKLHSLRLQDKAVLLEGLDGILPGNLLDKIWEMIWKRWCAHEDFCHKG